MQHNNAVRLVLDEKGPKIPNGQNLYKIYITLMSEHTELVLPYNVEENTCKHKYIFASLSFSQKSLFIFELKFLWTVILIVYLRVNLPNILEIKRALKNKRSTGAH